MFPIDPGADATIGGMAATRASGTTAVRYGTMRENVLGADGRARRRTRRHNRHARAQVAGRLRPDAALRRIRRDARRHHRGDGPAASACRRRSPPPSARSNRIRGAVDTVIATIQLGVPVARIELLDDVHMDAINRYSNTSLSGRADAAVRVPWRQRRARREPGGDGPGARRRTRRARVRVGHPPRGTRAAVGRAPQRALSPRWRSGPAAARGRPTSASRFRSSSDCVVETKRDHEGLPFPGLPRRPRR